MHGISCSAWHGAVVFESARSGIRPARSSPSPVVIYTRAVRSVISSDNHWPSLVSCCSRNCLEHFACLCPVITIYCNLSPAAEDILVPTVISGHHHLTLLCYRGLRNSYCGLVSDTANRSATSWQQVVVMDLGNDTTQQTQRTFARANLLRTCCGETGEMDFGFYYTERAGVAELSGSMSGFRG